MAVVAGRKVHVKLDTTGTGPSGSPNWVSITGERGGDLSVESEHADGTTKGHAGWKTGVPTIKGWQIECEGALDPGDPVLAQLRNSQKGDVLLWVQWNRDDIAGTTEYGQAYVTNYSESAPVGDVVSYSFTLMGDGALDPASV